MRKYASCVAFLVLMLCLVCSTAADGQLPPVPFPAENPPTEEKRILGKILFWDEQLSSDDTVACGTCHQAGAGGSDPRLGTHPGPDGLFGWRVAQVFEPVLGGPRYRFGIPDRRILPEFYLLEHHLHSVFKIDAGLPAQQSLDLADVGEGGVGLAGTLGQMD